MPLQSPLATGHEVADSATDALFGAPGVAPSRLAESVTVRLTEAILEGRLKSGARLTATRDLARQLGVARGTVVVAYESLVAEGYRMRVYVPFGTQWYPYLMRRLAERPANVAFITGNVVREMIGGKS